MVREGEKFKQFFAALVRQNISPLEPLEIHTLLSKLIRSSDIMIKSFSMKTVESLPRAENCGTGPMNKKERRTTKFPIIITFIL